MLNSSTKRPPEHCMGHIHDVLLYIPPKVYPQDTVFLRSLQRVSIFTDQSLIDSQYLLIPLVIHCDLKCPAYTHHLSNLIMVALIERGKVRYLKNVNIDDLERQPLAMSHLRKQLADKDCQIAEKDQEKHQLEIALATERGYCLGAADRLQDFLDGVDFADGKPLQVQAQKQLLSADNGNALPEPELPIERYLKQNGLRRVDTVSTSRSRRPR